MRLLLVADGRSTITRSWLACLQGTGVDIYLVSTFPSEKPSTVKEMLVLPVAFSRFAGGQVKMGSTSAKRQPLRKILSGMRSIFLRWRYRLGPLTLSAHRTAYLDFIDRVKPDVVHALRIPFEGMLASFTSPEIPLIVSTWGNDLTLHAKGSRQMAAWTRRTLSRADGLMADATRDLQLAQHWGFESGRPTMMVPGNGGLDLSIFKTIRAKREHGQGEPHKMRVVNPRGFRPGSVHQEVFFKAIPYILERFPNVEFICPALQGQNKAMQWVRESGLDEAVTLLPYLPQNELWELYRTSDIYVSLSSHDGTPNTFLEAIACGCYPIVGDIASLREWVQDEENGRLIDPRDVQQVVETIIDKIQDNPGRDQAARRNWQILQDKADRSAVQKKVLAFYQHFQSIR